MRRLWISGLLAGCLCSSALQLALGQTPESGAEADELLLDVQPASFQAEPAQPASRPAATPAARRAPGSTYMRLARVPSMFGDSLAPCGELEVCTSPVGEFTAGGGSFGSATSTFGIPCPGGGPAKIAENDKALPVDRVFFYYNGFQDAYTANVSAPFVFPGVAATIDSPGAKSFDFHRYTVGFEKTFNDKQNSFEIRMPFNSGFEIEQSEPFDFLTVPGINADGVGNLAFVLKQVLWSDADGVVALGLTLDVPTGSDVKGSVGSADFTLHNEAAHFGPFLGFLSLLSEDVFVQGFVQLGMPLQGNEIEVSGDNISIDEFRATQEIDEQNLLYLDFSAGYWIDRRWLAAVVELHYTTTLDDADTANVAFFDFGSFSDTELTFGSSANRVDFLNLALGLHGQITRNTNVRVAGVVPLRDDSDEPFESEIQVSVNHHF